MASRLQVNRSRLDRWPQWLQSIINMDQLVDLISMAFPSILS
jgi:hypothetical protein